MAMSYLAESAAPRDFHISSTESTSHYTKCLLCYTIKKNFYCVDCIKAGNFVHSSIPYSERFADKQLKLFRVKANRKHIKDRCEALLRWKSKQDGLQVEWKQCKERVELLKLAIQQSRASVCSAGQQLGALAQYNAELAGKLPRYDKRVASLGRHARAQQAAVQDQAGACQERALALAALRRARLRHLINYIFPVYMAYDTRVSAEDVEFLHVESERDALRDVRLHIGAPWLPANGDYSHYTHWVSQHKEAAGGAGAWSPEGVDNAAYRISAGLTLAAQLTVLVAWCLDVRLPHSLSFSDYSSTCLSESSLGARVRRLGACAVALGLRARLTPPAAPAHALTLLHALSVSANTDDASLGRVEQWVGAALLSVGEQWAAAWGAPEPSDDDEPEHLHWAALDAAEEMSVISTTPPAAPAASLVTSAAASLASLWRGWTK